MQFAIATVLQVCTKIVSSNVKVGVGHTIFHSKVSTWLEMKWWYQIVCLKIILQINLYGQYTVVVLFYTGYSIRNSTFIRNRALYKSINRVFFKPVIAFDWFLSIQVIRFHNLTCLNSSWVFFLIQCLAHSTYLFAFSPFCSTAHRFFLCF